MLTMEKVLVMMMMFCSRSWLLLVWGLITLLLYGLVALSAVDRSVEAAAAVADTNIWLWMLFSLF